MDEKEKRAAADMLALAWAKERNKGSKAGSVASSMSTFNASADRGLQWRILIPNYPLRYPHHQRKGCGSCLPCGNTTKKENKVRGED